MSGEIPDPVDPRVTLAHDRTDMASYRTALALDRSTLAWLRTTLSMTSFGFGLVTFIRSIEDRQPGPRTIRLHQGAIRMGVSLILIGIVATLFAGLSHWFALKRLRRGESPIVSKWPLSITVAMLTVVFSLAALWALFVP